MSKPTIMKFGGTSVEDERAFERLVNIVSTAYSLKSSPVVVVSAMSGVTNALLASVGQATADDPVGGRCLVHELPVPARRGRPAQRARQPDLVQPGVHVPGPHRLIRAARLVVQPKRVEPVLDAERVQSDDLAGRRVDAARDGGADVVHDRLLPGVDERHELI